MKSVAPICRSVRLGRGAPRPRSGAGVSTVLTLPGGAVGTSPAAARGVLPHRASRLLKRVVLPDRRSRTRLADPAAYGGATGRVCRPKPAGPIERSVLLERG